MARGSRPVLLGAPGGRPLHDLVSVRPSVSFLNFAHQSPALRRDSFGSSPVGRLPEGISRCVPQFLQFLHDGFRDSPRRIAAARIDRVPPDQL